ncbi:hypothetical protein GCM10009738_57460 [Kitasatospora viridis]
MPPTARAGAGYGYQPQPGPQPAADGPATQVLPPYPGGPAPAHAPYPGHPGHPGPADQPPPGFRPPPAFPPPAGHGLDLPGQYQDDADEDRPRRRAPLLIGAGLVLLLAIGGGAVLATQDSGASKPTAKAAPPTGAGSARPSPSGGGPADGGVPAGPGSAASPSTSASAGASASASPSAGANAQSEATALDALLTKGESAKAPIGSAVAQVDSCPAKADVDSAAQVFDSGAQQRDQLLATLTTLNVADVPGGADAVASLKTAWQTSADIDRAYAAWARSVSAGGCGGSAHAPDTPDKQKADQLNPQATQAKQDFVAKWNALAPAYGLASRTWDRI